MRIQKTARRLRIKILLAVSTAVIGMLAVVGVWWFYSPYEIVEIPMLGVGDTLVRRINDAGQVVGHYTEADGARRTFVWDEVNGAREIEALTGYNAFVEGFNNSGQIAGRVIDPNGGESPFFWDPNDGLHSFGIAGREGLASAMNDSGQVVGWTWVAGTGQSRAFLWSRDAGMIDLGALEYDYASHAFAVSNRGQVAGVSGGGKVFLWSSDEGMMDTGLRNGCEDMVLGDDGAIAACLDSTSELRPSLTLWREGHETKRLGSFSTGNLCPQRMNTSGQVLVWCPSSGIRLPRNLLFMHTESWLWDPKGGWMNLRKHCKATGEYAALDLNNHGWIVVSKRDRTTGWYRGLILRPRKKK